MENLKFELDDMRSQIAALKNKIDKQEVVNERIMRDAMQSRVFGISSKVTWGIVGALLFCPLFVVFHFIFGLSWALVGVTCVLALVYAVVVYRIYKPMTSKDFMNGNVADVASTISRIKGIYANWFKRTWYVGLPWVIWFVYEFAQSQHLTGVVSYLPMAIGLAIGLYFGRRQNKKNVEMCDVILGQLKSL